MAEFEHTCGGDVIGCRCREQWEASRDAQRLIKEVQAGVAEGHSTPFQTTARPGQLDMSRAVTTGGVVVLALYVDVPLLGRCPAVAFQFADPHSPGGFLPPVIHVADAETLAKLPALVQSAVDLAIQGAGS